MEPVKSGTSILAALVLSGCATGSANLITRDGQLAPCEAHQCVNSLAPRDSWRYVPPIRYAGTTDAARNALVRIIAGMEGARIVSQTEDYVHATFTSKLARFVDDLELVFEPGARVVQVRSASRLGYYDLDVNRERVEAIRAAFEALQP